jgi:ribosomal small subunit protein bTHX
MGKGDVKTRRGKIFRGSHGKLRPHNKQKQQVIKSQDNKKK